MRTVARYISTFLTFWTFAQTLSAAGRCGGRGNVAKSSMAGLALLAPLMVEKFRSVLLLRWQVDDDRRLAWRLAYFEAHEARDRADDRRSRGHEKGDVARVLPDVLLAPQIEVRHQQLLSQLFLFVIRHTTYRARRD